MRTIPARQLGARISSLPPQAHVVVGRDGQPLLTIRRPCRQTGAPVHEVVVCRGTAFQIEPLNTHTRRALVRRAFAVAFEMARDSGVPLRELLSNSREGDGEEPEITCEDLRWMWKELGCGDEDGVKGKGGGMKLEMHP